MLDKSSLSRTLSTAVATFAILAAGLNAAQATPLKETFSLNATSVSQFGSGPFGSVTLTASGANVNVEVDLLAGFDFVSTGSAGSHSLFAFESIPGSTVSGILFDGISGAYTVSAPAGASPFGTFDYGIFCDTCRNGASGKLAGPLTFTVDNANLNSFIGPTAGLNSAYFAADLIGSSGSTGEVAAIHAGTVTGSSVPEPAALGLLGLGAMLVLFGRRRQAHR
jgi:hypothetical protein